MCADRHKGSKRAVQSDLDDYDGEEYDVKRAGPPAKRGKSSDNDSDIESAPNSPIGSNFSRRSGRGGGGGGAAAAADDPYPDWLLEGAEECPEPDRSDISDSDQSDNDVVGGAVSDVLMCAKSRTMMRKARAGRGAAGGAAAGGASCGGASAASAASAASGDAAAERDARRDARAAVAADDKRAEAEANALLADMENAAARDAKERETDARTEPPRSLEVVAMWDLAFYTKDPP